MAWYEPCRKQGWAAGIREDWMACPGDVTGAPDSRTEMVSRYWVLSPVTNSCPQHFTGQTGAP